MTDPRTPPEDWRDLAAEYALGVLSGEELRFAGELDRSDAAFSAEVARWRGRLGPMLDDVAEASPSSAAWARIAARTFQAREESNVVELHKRVRRWQGFTAAATAIAAALGLVVLTNSLDRLPVSPAPNAQYASAPMVAMLGRDAQPTAVVASWEPSAKQLILAVPGNLRSMPNHAHELWVIPAGGKPRSLGTMPSGRQMHMKLAEAIARLLDDGATIAISVEPAGGSPTGSPTGPVIASGALRPA